jgi:hypothetical protein
MVQMKRMVREEEEMSQRTSTESYYPRTVQIFIVLCQELRLISPQTKQRPNFD